MKQQKEAPIFTEDEITNIVSYASAIGLVAGGAISLTVSANSDMGLAIAAPLIGVSAPAILTGAYYGVKSAFNQAADFVHDKLNFMNPESAITKIFANGAGITTALGGLGMIAGSIAPAMQASYDRVSHLNPELLGNALSMGFKFAAVPAVATAAIALGTYGVGKIMDAMQPNSP